MHEIVLQRSNHVGMLHQTQHSIVGPLRLSDLLQHTFVQTRASNPRVSNIRLTGQMGPVKALYPAPFIIGLSQHCPFRSTMSAKALGGRDRRQGRGLARGTREGDAARC